MSKHNDSAGYGDLTNLIKVRRVLMVEHREGTGSDDSPTRFIQSIFDEDLKFIARLDPAKDYFEPKKPHVPYATRKKEVEESIAKSLDEKEGKSPSLR